MKIVRRKFLQLMASAPVASTIPIRPGEAEEALKQVRVATGLLAMWQSTAWLGAEAGIFKKHGIDLSLPAIAVGGPHEGDAYVRCIRTARRTEGVYARAALARLPERSRGVVEAQAREVIESCVELSRIRDQH